jgi:hypothetical protein
VLFLRESCEHGKERLGGGGMEFCEPISTLNGIDQAISMQIRGVCII